MNNEVIKILEKVEAIIRHGHFVGTSGLHLDTYINKDALFPHTEISSEVGKLFAEKYKNINVEAVVAPALGGIILSQWTAYHLSKLTGREIFGIYTEKIATDNQIFTRGYEAFVKDKKVLVIEDIATTGESVKKVISAVQNAGGKVLGACVMVNKNPKEVNSATIGVPFESLGEYDVETYEEKDCPLCQSGVPINTSVGHGKKYLENKK